MDAAKVGDFLASLRKSKGYTQQEVADELNVSNKTISKWEQGGGFPEITVLPALAEFYGVSADEILAGERIMKEASPRVRECMEERKRRLMDTAKRRFDLFFSGSLFSAAVSLIISGVGATCYYGYDHPPVITLPVPYAIFALVFAILGPAALAAGYAYVMMPLKTRTDLLDEEDLASLYPGLLRRIFVAGCVFLFAATDIIRKLFFKSVFLSGQADYVPDMAWLLLVAALWALLQKYLKGKTAGKTVLAPRPYGTIAGWTLAALFVMEAGLWIYDLSNIMGKVSSLGEAPYTVKAEEIWSIWSKWDTLTAWNRRISAAVTICAAILMLIACVKRNGRLPKDCGER